MTLDSNVAGQCFYNIPGRRIFLMDAEVVTDANDAPPGALIRIGRTACTIATGKDALHLRMARIDQEGEKSLSQLCRELGLEQGDCLV